MREVVKFEASDGTIHDSKDAALAHEQLIELREWYTGGREMYGNGSYHTLQWEDLIDWIRSYPKQARDLVLCIVAQGTQSCQTTDTD